MIELKMHNVNFLAELYGMYQNNWNMMKSSNPLVQKG